MQAKPGERIVAVNGVRVTRDLPPQALLVHPSGSKVELTIAAPGTSCRHQIADGTGRRALHPVEILHAALRR